ALRIYEDWEQGSFFRLRNSFPDHLHLKERSLFCFLNLSIHIFSTKMGILRAGVATIQTVTPIRSAEPPWVTRSFACCSSEARIEMRSATSWPAAQLEHFPITPGWLIRVTRPGQRVKSTRPDWKPISPASRPVRLTCALHAPWRNQPIFMDWASAPE